MPALLIFLVTFVSFGSSLRGKFVADDYLVIVGNNDIQSVSSIPRLFAQNYISNYPDQGLYRPLSNLSFALNYLFGKLNPFGYHLLNLLLHAFNGLLVYSLARRYTGRDLMSLSAALLFIAHPVHTEAVSNIAGRPEMLANAAVLLAWLFYSQENGQHWYWLSLTAYFFGLLAKESAVVLIGVLVLADQCSGSRPAYSNKTLKRYAGYLFVTGLYLLIRISVLHRFGVPVSASVFKDASVKTRVLTMSLACMRYFKLLIWPRDLIALYDFSVIPLTAHVTVPVFLSIMTIVGILLLGIWCVWHQRLVGFAILFFFVTISPVSNVIFPTGILMAERVLYLPVCGICLLVAGLLDALFRRRQPWRATALACFCLIQTAAMLGDNDRNPVWLDQIAYLKGLVRGLPNSPLAPKAIEELGSRLALDRKYSEAIGYLERAMELSPKSVDAAYNAGLVLEKLDRQDEAIGCLKHAVQISPQDVEIRNYYAAALLRSNQLDLARDEFEAVIAMKSDLAEAHNSLGVVYAKQQRYEQARHEFETALEIKPDYSDAMNNLQLLK